jgi:hypothetical protein
MSRYGNSFERKAIMNWLEEGNTFCPVTGNPLRPSCLVANTQLSWKIRCWFHQHGRESPISEENPGFTSYAIIAISPEKYLCALTHEIMVDPVMSETGFNFERDKILKYLDENNDTCPVSGKSLYPHQLVRNYALKHEIDDWRKLNDDHGSGLPNLNEVDLDILSPHSRKKAIIGIRGDPAITEMRALHAKHLKDLGLQDKDGMDDSLKEPFSESTVVDDAQHTMKNLGHVF